MLRRLLTSIILTTIVATASMAQVIIDGRTTARDSLTGNYLCSIPEENFGNNFTASAITFDQLINVTINGTPVNNGYTFNQISGNSTWTIAGEELNGTKHQAKLQFTFLPIVEINSKVEKYQYNTGTVIVLLPDKDIVSPCKVKFRGATTNIDTYKKRNYHLKFEDENGDKVDYKFFDDLRNDNNWLLDAGTIDRLRVRNRILTDLWLDFASKPYYADAEPKALNGSRGKMVEVFRNGEYQGYYNMCEPIDRKQMKLVKTDETLGELHGMLWKAANRTNNTRMVAVSTPNNNLSTWDGFEVKYPDFDDINPTDYTPLYNVINFVANSSDEEFEKHASEYLDIPVLIDYYIFLQLIYAYDNLGKNMYWGLYDKQEGNNKLTPAVWDLDTSMGQSWKRYEYHPSYLTPDQDIYTSSNLDNFLKRLIQWDVDSFVEKGAARYRELRKTTFDTHNMTQRVVDYVNMLDKCGATSREMTRWYKTDDLGGLSPDLAREMPYVIDWIEKRLNWLDKNYFNERIRGDINNDGVVDIADVNAIISHVLNPSSTPQVYYYLYDINHDRTIDVSDINATINKILQ